MGACTNGNYAMQYNLPGTFCPIADFDLVRRAAEICEREGVNYKVGNIFSSDTFYDDANSGMQWAKMGVLGVEMESAALYCNAARAGKKHFVFAPFRTVSFIPKKTPRRKKDKILSPK